MIGEEHLVLDPNSPNIPRPVWPNPTILPTSPGPVSWPNPQFSQHPQDPYGPIPQYPQDPYGPIPQYPQDPYANPALLKSLIKNHPRHLPSFSWFMQQRFGETAPFESSFGGSDKAGADVDYNANANQGGFPGNFGGAARGRNSAAEMDSSALGPAARVSGGDGISSSGRSSGSGGQGGGGRGRTSAAEMDSSALAPNARVSGYANSDGGRGLKNADGSGAARPHYSVGEFRGPYPNANQDLPGDFPPPEKEPGEDFPPPGVGYEGEHAEGPPLRMSIPAPQRVTGVPFQEKEVDPADFPPPGEPYVERPEEKELNPDHFPEPGVGYGRESARAKA